MLDPVEKARRTAQLLRQTREVWQAICRAEPTRQIGRAIEESKRFDQLDEEDRIWCAQLTVELRRVLAPRLLESEPTAPPATNEATPAPPPAPNSTPPNSPSSKGSNGALKVDAVIDRHGNETAVS